jgi:PTS system ascorbate-specific IIC component
MNNVQYVGVAIVIVFLLAIPQIIYYRNKDTYFLIAEDYEAYKELMAKKQGKSVEDVVIE